MAIRTDDRRTHLTLHSNTVRNAVPEFFVEQYPEFIQFLERYYEYMEGNESGSFSKQIQSLYNVRTISSIDGSHLDSLLAELAEGIQSDTFYDNPQLMARLLANFYRAKGTEQSVEQFFRGFFGDTVEIEYPKRNIFILNDKPGGSLIGPESIKFIVDNKKYQVFSILLKTGMSLIDYETIYKQFAHPAGFYLAAEVALLSHAIIGVRAGPTTDPLETPNYPVPVGSEVGGINLRSTFALMTLRETDPADITFILSALETLDRYDDITIERLTEVYTTYHSPSCLCRHPSPKTMSSFSF